MAVNRVLIRTPQYFFSPKMTTTERVKASFAYLFLLLIFYSVGHVAGMLFGSGSRTSLGFGSLTLLFGIAFIALYRKRALNLYKIPAAVVNLPVYCLSFVVPKDKALWLFSCRQGVAYAENSRYLYEHVVEQHLELRGIWITKSRSVYHRLKKNNQPVVMAYSLRGYWASLRAGCVFLSNFRRAEADYNDYAIGPGTLKIQLWHGSPMKRIGVKRPVDTHGWFDSLLRVAFYSIFPFYTNRTSCHKMLAASPLVAKTLRSAFNLQDRNMWVLGYPKNDNWLKRVGSVKSKDTSVKKVIYMPTWRKDGLNIFTDHRFDPKGLNQLFSDNDIQFYIKLHHFTIEAFVDEFEGLDELSNMHILRADDIYDTLDQYDMLVTDYSSILFDFLLADRPVIFASFDYDSYVSEDQGFMTEYGKITPGPHAQNWQELGSVIVEQKAEDNYAADRKRVCAMYNSYVDTGSAERVIKEAKAVLEEGIDTLEAAYH